MGLAKERYIRGLSFVAGAVCAECFGDAGLAEFVRGAASEHECDFCGAESESDPIAAPVDEVVEYMTDCLERHYEDPAEHVGWEGGWGITPSDTYELLTEDLMLDLPNDEDEQKLIEALSEGLGGRDREWMPLNPYGRPPEEFPVASWERFVTLVKHERRFFFREHPKGDDDDQDGLLSPDELLQRIAAFCEAEGLVRTIPAGTTIYRVRKAPDGKHPATALELGSPPADRCLLPTRMSAAGIPMFYGADDAETALPETVEGPGLYVIGRWELARDIRLLDLTDIRDVPSIFEQVSDTAEVDPREALIFLHSFTEDVSRPIDRKDRAHVDYVPTQVVAEYFRSTSPDGRHRLDGIKYTSAQRPPHASYAFFVGPEGIIPSEEDVRRYEAAGNAYLLGRHASAWLRLVDSTERIVTEEPQPAAEA